MIVLESKIAKKYALAFLSVHGESLTPQYLEAIATYADFVETNKLFQATLTIPSLSFEKKKLIVDHVVQKLTLPQSVTQLTFLLLKHKRIESLGGVLKKILLIREQQEKKHHFVVSTSHELTEVQKEAITAFIKKQVPNHITTSFVLDTSLISGIRIKGNRLLFERSIAKQLRRIEQNILRRE